MLGAAGIWACSDTSGNGADGGTSSPDASQGDSSAMDAPAPDASDDVANGDGGQLVATINTTMGTMVVTLDPAHAPLTVANFKQYADEKFYDGIIFDRVVATHLIQGGGMNSSNMVVPPTHPPIPDEAIDSGLSNTAGTIAMAREPNPDSATCVFFINTVDNSALFDPNTTDSGDPNGYAVFGKVTTGMDVLAAIAATPVDSNKKPITPVIINSLTVSTQ
jgi:cyclophilin family peptidyl-prolyl cis-trans isomerase